jgi:hypothetical protein
MTKVLHTHQKVEASVPNRIGELEKKIVNLEEVIKKLTSRLKKLESIEGNQVQILNSIGR